MVQHGCCLSLGSGELFIYLEGCLVPDLSISTHYVVPGFTRMHFSYHSATSSFRPLHYLFLRKLVWCISLIVPVLGGTFSARSCNIFISLVLRLLHG